MVHVVLLDDVKKIIDDGRGSDGSFIVTVVVEETD